MRAIAELTRNLDIAGHASPALEPVLGHRAGMKAGTAGYDLHALYPREQLSGIGPEGGRQHPVLRQAPLQRFGDRARLLVDLLEHKVAVLTALGGIRTELGRLYRTF